MPKCIHYTLNHIAYHGHLEIKHLCEDCAMYVSDKRQHRCLTPGQQGGHVDINAEIDLPEFAECHLGIVKVYMHKGEFETPDMEASFAQVNTALFRLLAQLYDIHRLYKV